LEPLAERIIGELGRAGPRLITYCQANIIKILGEKYRTVPDIHRFSSSVESP
jgi:hypothetical protein